MISNRQFSVLILTLELAVRCSLGVADEFRLEGAGSQTFLQNGVTAHRGNSGEYPENTMPAFESALAQGADWIELDLFRSKDGKLVVIHDATTERTGEINLRVTDSTYDELCKLDVAAAFRRRTGKSIQECPPQNIPLLDDVLSLVMQQHRTRVSIQPKMDCVSEAVTLVRTMHAEPWVGFNDGDLSLMAKVKQLAPEFPVFWDRGANTAMDDDLRIAAQHRFTALVLHHRGVTRDKVQKIKAAGFEVGAWTVNDREEMKTLLDAGVERIYTDYPQILLALKRERQSDQVTCEGAYPHHLQGVCVDDAAIFWSFTTTLVKTDLHGRVLKKIPVANHHGDLCHHDGRIYVAVNLGKFNDPQGNADSWVYVYDADTLNKLSQHATQEVLHGAGGIGFRNGRFYVVGGLPDGVEENYVYEYDDKFNFLTRRQIKSGNTKMGIQTATFADDRWWFGCYGEPKILLVTDANFQMLGRYEFDCSLGIAGLPNGGLLAASGRCSKEQGCTGQVRKVIPDDQLGLRYTD